MKSIPIITLLSTSLLLAACGGGGSDSDDSSAAASSIPGVYYGDVTPTDDTPGAATFLLSPNGRIVVLSDSGYGQGSLSYPSETGFSGKLTQFDGFGEKQSVALTGTRTASTFSGRASVSGTQTSTFAFEREPTFSDQGASFDAIAGTRTDTLLGTVTTITVDTDGTFVGNDDTGCDITGALTIPDARYNIYNVSASVSGCGQLDGTPGADRNGGYTGLGTLEPSGNSAARLIIAVDNGILPGIFLLY